MCSSRCPPPACTRTHTAPPGRTGGTHTRLSALARCARREEVATVVDTLCPPLAFRFFTSFVRVLVAFYVPPHLYQANMPSVANQERARFFPTKTIRDIVTEKISSRLSKGFVGALYDLTIPEKYDEIVSVAFHLTLADGRCTVQLSDYENARALLDGSITWDEATRSRKKQRMSREKGTGDSDYDTTDGSLQEDADSDYCKEPSDENDENDENDESADEDDKENEETAASPDEPSAKKKHHRETDFEGQCKRKKSKLNDPNDPNDPVKKGAPGSSRPDLQPDTKSAKGVKSAKGTKGNKNAKDSREPKEPKSAKTAKNSASARDTTTVTNKQNSDVAKRKHDPAKAAQSGSKSNRAPKAPKAPKVQPAVQAKAPNVGQASACPDESDVR